MIFISDAVEESGLSLDWKSLTKTISIPISYFSPYSPSMDNKLPTFCGEGALSWGYPNFWSSSKWQSYMLFSRWLKLENVKA